MKFKESWPSGFREDVQRCGRWTASDHYSPSRAFGSAKKKKKMSGHEHL